MNQSEYDKTRELFQEFKKAAAAKCGFDAPIDCSYFKEVQPLSDITNIDYLRQFEGLQTKRPLWLQKYDHTGEWQNYRFFEELTQAQKEGAFKFVRGDVFNGWKTFDKPEILSRVIWVPRDPLVYPWKGCYKVEHFKRLSDDPEFMRDLEEVNQHFSE